MAAKTYSKEEIARMSYEVRYSHFKQEEEELLRTAVHVNSQDLANRHKQLLTKWQV